MPRHLIGDAHEWINEIPTVPTHSLAKLQPSQRSWELYLCVRFCVTRYFSTTFYVSLTLAFRAWDLNDYTHNHTTAGQEDPFELDSNLLLSSGRHGEDRKRQYVSTYDHETPLHDDLADLLY